MANCENIPTLQTVQDFNTNAQVFNEVVTSDLDETTLEDSEGNKHLTLVGMAKEMDGLQGPVGPTPPHEWDGTNLRFAQAVHWDSTLMEYVVDEWGNYEDLWDLLAHKVFKVCKAWLARLQFMNGMAQAYVLPFPCIGMRTRVLM